MLGITPTVLYQISHLVMRMSTAPPVVAFPSPSFAALCTLPLYMLFQCITVFALTFSMSCIIVRCFQRTVLEIPFLRRVDVVSQWLWQLGNADVVFAVYYDNVEYDDDDGGVYGIPQLDSPWVPSIFLVLTMKKNLCSIHSLLPPQQLIDDFFMVISILILPFNNLTTSSGPSTIPYRWYSNRVKSSLRISYAWVSSASLSRAYSSSLQSVSESGGSSGGGGGGRNVDVVVLALLQSLLSSPR